MRRAGRSLQSPVYEIQTLTKVYKHCGLPMSPLSQPSFSYAHPRSNEQVISHSRYNCQLMNKHPLANMRLFLEVSLATLALAMPLVSCQASCTLPCASNAVCISDPTPRCVVPDGVCGGFAGFKCTDEANYCVDDPRDDCDPDDGGADCIGICVEPPACV